MPWVDLTVINAGRIWSRRWWIVLLAVLFATVAAVTLVPSSSDGHRRLPSARSVARPTSHAPPEVVSTTTAPDHGLAPLLPTSASPLRILEIGDSLGIDLGDQLQAQADAGGTARTTVASVGDSGLSNAAYFDWPARLGGLLAGDRPQVVVVFIGANDDQGMEVGGVPAAPGTAAWAAGYAQRVDDIVGEATGTGARVAWVGMPPMENADLDTAMQREDAIYERETTLFPGALYISSDSVVGSPTGLYERTSESVSGGQVALRTADGVHLTPAGAAVLAHGVIDAIDSRWGLSLSPPALSRSPTVG